MSISVLTRDPGVAESLTDDDIRCLSSSLYHELVRVNDPHEFATAFVNWRVRAPEGATIDLFSAYKAVDWWRAYGTLATLPYERLGNG
jgi:hypothetical protein